MRKSVLGGFLLLLALAIPRAQADTIQTFDFSGTLFFSFTGTNSVTGPFSLDETNGTLTAFDFITPAFEFTPSDSVAVVETFTPALNPNTDFVFIDIENPLNALTLLFQTSLSPFAGNTFYTGNVTAPNGVVVFSSVIDDTVFYFSNFTSGEASPAIPEPSSISLILSGLAPLGLAGFHSRRGKSVGMDTGVGSVR